MEKNRIWDPGWKNSDPGIRDGKNSDPDGKNSDPGWKNFGGIRDKHPRSATLVTTNTFVEKGPERASWQILALRSFPVRPRVAL